MKEYLIKLWHVILFGTIWVLPAYLTGIPQLVLFTWLPAIGVIAYLTNK